MPRLRVGLPKLLQRRGAPAAGQSAKADSGRRLSFARGFRGPRNGGRPAGVKPQDRSSLITAKRLRLVLGLIVLLVLVLVPGRCARNTINEIESDGADVQSEVDVLQSQVQQSLTLEADRTEFEEAYAAVRAAMPEGPALPEVIEQLVALEQSTGAHLVNLSPSPPSEGGVSSAISARVHELALSLKVIGEEQSVLAFVDGLRGLPRLIVVDSVGLSWRGNQPTPATVTESGPGNSLGELDADITARLFVWVPDTAQAG